MIDNPGSHFDMNDNSRRKKIEWDGDGRCTNIEFVSQFQYLHPTCHTYNYMKKKHKSFMKLVFRLQFTWLEE